MGGPPAEATQGGPMHSSFSEVASDTDDQRVSTLLSQEKDDFPSTSQAVASVRFPRHSNWNRRAYGKPAKATVISSEPKEGQELVEDGIYRVEAKLDHLSNQVADCLAGIRVLYHNGSAQASKPGHRGLSRAPSRDTNPGRRPPEGDHGPRRPVGDQGPSLVNGHIEFTTRASPDALMRASRLSNNSGLNSGMALRWHDKPPSPQSSMRGARASSITRSVSIQDHASSSSLHLPSDLSSDVEESGASSATRRGSFGGFMARKARGRVSIYVWNIIDNPESSPAAAAYNRIMPLFILTSVIISLAYALVPEKLPGDFMFWLELGIEALFAVEIVTRYCVCPNHCLFFRSLYNLIDILSVLPVFGRAVVHFFKPADLELLVLLGFVPAVRLLKSLRRYEQIHLLTKAFKMALEALPAILYTQLVVWLFSAAALLLVEERSNISTLGQAMWLTFCSMTTATFGDYFPESILGKVIISALVTSSTLYMAIPIGIIGNCFSHVWTDRDKILLVERMRQVFVLNGFTANDVPVLFNHFDPDGNGILSAEEFLEMATTLKLGLAEDRLLTLFQIFETDSSGGIDDKEFCKIIFPEAYYLVYRTSSAIPSDYARSKSWFPNFLL